VGDARALVDRARIECQINRVSYDEPIEVEALAKKLCDHMQTLTQYGGIRPYGTALLIAGVSDGESRLFETDPSGTLLEYKATGIGIGRPAAMKVFEDEYTPEVEIKDAIMLGLKALHSATEGKFDVDTVEIGVIGKEKPVFRKMTKEEVAAFVEQFKQ
jgi:proteasome alpha subunit